MINVVKSLWTWEEEKEKSENTSEQTVISDASTVVSQPKSLDDDNKNDTIENEDVSDLKTQLDYSELDKQMEEDLKAVVSSAKEWGSYLFNVGKNATVMAANQVNEAAKFIKEQVEESGNIDQDKCESSELYLDSPHAPPNTPIVTKAVPQWLAFLTPSFSNFNDSEERVAVLQLSADKENFLIQAETESSCPELSTEQLYSSAIAALKFDERLKEMRFILVPRKIKEEKFWRNYFQRVWLITQSYSMDNRTSSLASETEKRLQVTDKAVNDENEESQNVGEDNRLEVNSQQAPPRTEDPSPDEELQCPQVDVAQDLPVPSSDNVSLEDFEIVAKEDVDQDPDESSTN